MSKVDFKKSAEEVVELVGGRKNIEQISHCFTRVRFTLKDNGIASENKEKITQIDGVIQVVEAGGQFQVVVGTQVQKMYDEIMPLLGMETGEKEMKSASEDVKTKKKLSDQIMKLVSGIIMPVIPVLAGCGLIMCLLTILTMTKLVNPESGTFMILQGMGQACLYFFPILIGGSAAKYFGMDQYVGNIIGAALIYPSLVTAATEGMAVKFLGVIPVSFQNYTNTVFPAIVAVWFGSLLYKFFKKHIPDVLSFSIVPLLTVLFTVPIALIVIGPVVNTVSGFLSKGMLALFELSPVLCGAILGATWLLFIVPLGLHWGFMAIFMNNIVTLGYEPMLGLLAGILSMSGILLAFGLKSKDANMRSLAFGSALTNALGISEPGLYGIILQHKETMIIGMIGGAISGIIPALFHTYCYVVSGAAGLLALPCYIAPDGNMTGFWGAILSNVVGFIVCFALTWFWKFDTTKSKK